MPNKCAYKWWMRWFCMWQPSLPQIWLMSKMLWTVQAGASHLFSTCIPLPSLIITAINECLICDTMYWSVSIDKQKLQVHVWLLKWFTILHGNVEIHKQESKKISTRILQSLCIFENALCLFFSLYLTIEQETEVGHVSLLCDAFVLKTQIWKTYFVTPWLYLVVFSH